VSWLGPRIDVRPLFAEQHARLLALLRGLSASDWARPTACPGWTVHDIATHLLGDHVGRLSLYRDGFEALSPADGEPFPAFLHRINGEWVAAARRISPAVLLDLLAATGDQVVGLWRDADLDAPGWNVSWATGPDPAPVWLDAARDFSEFWTHQQQIAEACGVAGPSGLAVVLDIFMRALPWTLRDTDAAPGTALRMTVTGDAGGVWTVARDRSGWAFAEATTAAASITLDQDTAWRLCTRGISPEEAARRARVEGDGRLTDAALRIVSIVY